MALRDVFNGMMNGPRGQRRPSTGRSGKGMSRIFMALLGLLAYKAFKGEHSGAKPGAERSEPSATPVAVRKAGQREP
jgi:hypothetical protein